jgi:hypothetical protein
VHLRIAGLGVRGDATLADFLRRNRSPADPPTVAGVAVWPSPDEGWPDVPAADADDVPPEYRGVIPDGLLVRPQDVVLEKWLGKGSFGDAYKAGARGSAVVVKVRCPACYMGTIGAMRQNEQLSSTPAVRMASLPNWQTIHSLEDPALYGIEVDSPEHVYQLLGVLAEVKPFLSRAGRCTLIIALVGVIVDERRRPVKPLFELADCGSLEDYIKRGWESVAAGVRA